MTVADLIDYLVERNTTHDLALQLAFVLEQRQASAPRGPRVATH